ncbi:hypothetical protein [Salinigranum salinum]|uniref:hypothetical protein n=1 Tax=Salinigranum salinum TaxID=1364937 RepID=UPI0012608674|nr:hypothetical protein [Salinigranum salinum]
MIARLRDVASETVGGDARETLLVGGLALLAVTSAIPLPASAAATDETSAAGGVDPATTANRTTGALTFDHTFERLPDRPGDVRVTVETTAPEHVTSVAIQVPENATVVETDGYERTGDDGETAWIWDRSDADTDRPTVSYVVNVDRTDDGTREAASTGEWALFNWRTADVEWRYERVDDTPEPVVVERGHAAGEGVVGPGYAYLGPSETYSRTVDGETIRLVVPQATEMAESPRAVLAALATASDDLRVGARNERLTVFVAPDPIDASGRLSRAEVDGRQDVYVAADEPLDTPDNAWFHEYVHSRQSYETAPGMAWFDDASAEYYAAWLAYEGGHVSREAFYDHVRTDEERDAVLAETESVDDDASYFKGMRVLAALDAEIREASDGDRTLRAVVAAMNAHDREVDRTAFASFVADAAGDPHDEWLATYVGTSQAPPVPDYLPGARETAVDDGVRAMGDDVGAAPLTAQLLFVGGVVLAVWTLRSRFGSG